MKIVHKEGQQIQIPCPKCGKQFSKQRGIKQHLFQVHNPDREQTKRCHIWQEEFRRVPLLYKHLRDVHQVEAEALSVAPLFICSQCGVGYNNETSLLHHVDRKHTEESERKWKYKCPTCFKIFSKTSLLEKHVSDVHSSGNEPVFGGDSSNPLPPWVLSMLVYWKKYIIYHYWFFWFHLFWFHDFHFNWVCA